MENVSFREILFLLKMSRVLQMLFAAITRLVEGLSRNNSNNNNNNNNNNLIFYYLCAESTATRPITDAEHCI
jgi:hypothetical protein